MKKARRETQTLRAGCKSEPKKIRSVADPLSGDAARRTAKI